MITIALLVPMGNGKADSGPADSDCIWGLPLLLWGSPGIGKSGRIKAAGKAIDLPVRSVFASTRAPEDFSGAPFIKDGSLVNECILGAVRDLCGLGKGILFLDELSCTAQAVQAALLNTIFDRLVGDTKLPNKVRILAAANPPQEAAGGWELEPPMANRFAHFQVDPPTTDEWINWLFRQEEVVETISIEEDKVVANWPSAIVQANGMMAGFLKSLSNDSKLYNMPAANAKERGRAWPSPRAWDFARRAVATCIALESPKEYRQEFVEACIGTGVASEWAEWVRKADLPTPHDVVTLGWTPDKVRIDRTFAVLSAMTAYVVNEADTVKKKQYAEGAWKVLTKAKDLGLVDLTVDPADKLIKAQLGSKGGPALEAASRELLLHQGLAGIVGIARGI